MTDLKGGTFHPDELLVTGRNETGQLALPGCHSAKPQKAQLPVLLRGERVAEITTQFGRTALRTTQGRLFVTLPHSEDEKDDPSDEDDDKRRARRKGRKEQDKKDRREPSKKEKERGCCWQEIECGRILAQSLLKGEVAVVTLWRSSKKKKMKMAKQAVNKVLWDDSLRDHVEEFRVGYQDKYMGVL